MFFSQDFKLCVYKEMYFQKQNYPEKYSLD